MYSKTLCIVFLVLAAVILTSAPGARADIVTDSNARAADIASKHPATPIAVRTMAIVHPEYPCAHCIVSASPGAVLEAEIGAGRVPNLSSASSTASGVVRTWTSIGNFVQEVAVARIDDGVHNRNSTEVGTAMGKKIGELSARSFPKATR